MKDRTWHIDLEVRTAEHKLFQDADGNKATEFQFEWFARDFDHLEHLMKQCQRKMNIILPDAMVYLSASLLNTNMSDHPSLHTWSRFASWYGPEQRFVIHE